MLPDLPCDVWGLRHVAGCSQREAAKVCGVSASTFLVWEQVGRAPSDLIGLLAEEALAFVEAAAAPIRAAVDGGEACVRLVRYVDRDVCLERTGWSVERFEKFLTLQMQYAALEGLEVEIETR